VSRPWVTSGSQIERTAECPPSAALAQVREVSEDEVEVDPSTSPPERGKAVHSYLQAIAEVGQDRALKLVPDEHRELCATLDLTGIDHLLALTPEVAFAYNCITDTARELGRAGERDVAYDSVTADEVPCQLDVVGVSVDRRRGLYVDWKTGWSKRTRARRNQQLWFGGLCMARAYGLEEVTVQLVTIGDHRKPYVQTATLTAFDIDGYALEVQELHREVMALREAAARGIRPTGFSVGPWCRYCKSRRVCDAQTALVRAAVGRDWIEEVMRMIPMPPEVAGDALLRIREARNVLNLAEKMVQAAARSQPLPLGQDRDGLYHWYGMTIVEGNEELDAAIAQEVLRAEWPPHVIEETGELEDVGLEIVDLATTKKAIEQAVGARAARGTKAKTLERIYDAIRARGGARRSTSVKPIEYTTKDPRPRAVPALPPGKDKP
jgi:hypothetical protein